jgi:hypothetical protein
MRDEGMDGRGKKEKKRQICVCRTQQLRHGVSALGCLGTNKLVARLDALSSALTGGTDGRETETSKRGPTNHSETLPLSLIFLYLYI